MAPSSEGGDAVSSSQPQRSLPSSCNTSSDSHQVLRLPTLPFDLVVEILCRLPVKPLLRFRCVCKSWNALISDPEFAKKHLRCLPTNFTRHHLVLSHYANSAPYFNPMDYRLLSVFNAADVLAPATQLKFAPYNKKGFHIFVDSCDGIICLIAKNYILLWNLSIQRFKTLPAFEIFPTIYGFGYDHFTNTYKVAILCYKTDIGGYYKTQVLVHTLGTDSWREIQEFPSCVPFLHGRFVSGTLNWLVSNESNLFIISLGLGNECYQKLLLPDCGGEVETLGLLRDCLSILSGDDHKVCNVWLMKEYGNHESWTKLFSVPTELFPYNMRLRALHISEDDELLVAFNSKLFLYNSKDSTLKTPQIHNIARWVVPVVYVESLISPSLDIRM